MNHPRPNLTVINPGLRPCTERESLGKCSTFLPISRSKLARRGRIVAPGSQSYTPLFPYSQHLPRASPFKKTNIYIHTFLYHTGLRSSAFLSPIIYCYKVSLLIELTIVARQFGTPKSIYSSEALETSSEAYKYSEVQYLLAPIDLVETLNKSLAGWVFSPHGTVNY